MMMVLLLRDEVGRDKEKREVSQFMDVIQSEKGIRGSLKNGSAEWNEVPYHNRGGKGGDNKRSDKGIYDYTNRDVVAVEGS